ncbi:MAG: hypothetical protein ABI669_15825, partial [Usitatibacter sp.]
PLKPKVIELAAEIFARLACVATTINDKDATLKGDPVTLARLSFTLAAAFQKVEDDINAEALPKNVGFKVQDSDIAGWMK